MGTRIVVQTEPLALTEIHEWLQLDPKDGAIVTFCGKVRSRDGEILSLYLEHYPGMTESVLDHIIESARHRWRLNKIAICHRIGNIGENESIVFVGVSAPHRSEAFLAAEFIMDKLKNEAPFWKKELGRCDKKWVQAKYSDKEALKKWNI